MKSLLFRGLIALSLCFGFCAFALAQPSRPTDEELYRRVYRIKQKAEKVLHYSVKHGYVVYIPSVYTIPEEDNIPVVHIPSVDTIPEEDTILEEYKIPNMPVVLEQNLFSGRVDTLLNETQVIGLMLPASGGREEYVQAILSSVGFSPDSKLLTYPYHMNRTGMTLVTLGEDRPLGERKTLYIGPYGSGVREPLYVSDSTFYIQSNNGYTVKYSTSLRQLIDPKQLIYVAEDIYPSDASLDIRVIGTVPKSIVATKDKKRIEDALYESLGTLSFEDFRNQFRTGRLQEYLACDDSLWLNPKRVLLNVERIEEVASTDELGEKCSYYKGFGNGFEVILPKSVYYLREVQKPIAFIVAMSNFVGEIGCDEQERISIEEKDGVLILDGAVVAPYIIPIIDKSLEINGENYPMAFAEDLFFGDDGFVYYTKQKRVKKSKEDIAREKEFFGWDEKHRIEKYQIEEVRGRKVPAEELYHYLPQWLLDYKEVEESYKEVEE